LGDQCSNIQCFCTICMARIWFSCQFLDTLSVLSVGMVGGFNSLIIKHW